MLLWGRLDGVFVEFELKKFWRKAARNLDLNITMARLVELLKLEHEETSSVTLRSKTYGELFLVS